MRRSWRIMRRPSRQERRTNRTGANSPSSGGGWGRRSTENPRPMSPPTRWARAPPPRAPTLRRPRGPPAADGDLLRLRRQVRAFGFIGARLDVRQHRAVVRAAGIEVVNRLGAASDRRRSATLNPLPISPDAGRWSPATGNLLATLSAMAAAQKAAPGSAQTFILSMTESGDDILQTLFLAGRAGLHAAPAAPPKSGLDVVPLFETSEAVDRAPAINQGMLRNPVYARQLD